MAKTFSILGDSISTFDGWNPPGFDVFYSDERLEKTGVTHVEQTWWHLLIDHFDGTLLKNGSFSGSLVEGGFFPPAIPMRAQTRFWAMRAKPPTPSYVSSASTITAGAARK